MAPAFKPLDPRGIIGEKLYDGLNPENLPRVFEALRSKRADSREVVLRPVRLLAAGLLGLLACLAALGMGYPPPGFLWLLPAAVALYAAVATVLAMRGAKRVRYLNDSLEDLLRLAVREKGAGRDFPAFSGEYLVEYHPEKVKAGLAGRAS